MESRMLLLPEPFSPVIALKNGSKFGTTVRCAYDLKPSSTTSSMYIAAVTGGGGADARRVSEQRSGEV
jgi:hypothetical protein